MPGLRQFLKTIPAVEYCYGRYKLQRYRRAYGPEFSRLLDVPPRAVPPLHRANSLNQFEWVVRHPLFPGDLLERLMPPGERPAMERAFLNFALGYLAEQRLAAEWQRSLLLSDAAERRLTEFLNRYITYALRTFAVHLEMHGDPRSPDAVRLRRVTGELEGETGDLLDIGCAFVPLAERYARTRRWVGLDLSLPALAIGRIVHSVPVASLVCGYSEDLPFPDAAFDVVVSSEVLEHTPRPGRMIAQIARVLRDGGKAILSVPMHIVDYQDDRQHLIGPTDSTHRFQFHTLDGLQTLFGEHGLTVEHLLSDPHYIFTLRKNGVRCSEFGVRDDPNTEHRTPNTGHRLFACPDCGIALELQESLRCSGCGTAFPRRDGIPVLLPQRLRDACLDLVD
jgi:SAM-dependent methyltransferase